MIKEAIGQLVGGHSLTMDESSTVMNEIMEGTRHPSPIRRICNGAAF